MSKNTTASSYRAWQSIRDHLKEIKSLQRTIGPTGTGISATEYYDLVIAMTHDLLKHLSEEHYRTPRKNPGIMWVKGMFDVLGNPLLRRIDFSRDLTSSDRIEQNSLLLIIEDLVSLKRNRRLARWRRIYDQILQAKPSRKAKAGKKKRNNSSRSKFLWWYRK